VPADVCVIETGLGGRLDATNILAASACTGLATLGLDHEAFLLSPDPALPARALARIAFEKASIAKPGCPLVTLSYPALAMETVRATAQAHEAPLFARGQAWDARIDDAIHYHDARGTLMLPCPRWPEPIRPKMPLWPSPCCATRARWPSRQRPWPPASAPRAGPPACNGWEKAR
jgi:dihydrofolate synthase/folylpolyglutamate synthase